MQIVFVTAGWSIATELQRRRLRWQRRKLSQVRGGHAALACLPPAGLAVLSGMEAAALLPVQSLSRRWSARPCRMALASVTLAAQRWQTGLTDRLREGLGGRSGW